MKNQITIFAILIILLNIIFPLNLFVNNVKADDNSEPEAYFYEHFIPPSGSFGLGETTFKTINTSLLKQKIKNNCDWALQVRNPQTDEWVNITDRLNIGLDWLNVSDAYKITMNFTTLDVGQKLDYRIALLFKQRVKNFVNRTGDTEVTFNIPANSTVDFNLTFNWSDMLQYQNLIFRRGTKVIDGEDYFYFIVRRNDVPPDFYVELDPWFGSQTVVHYQARNVDVQWATWFEAGGSGTVDNMTIFTRLWESGQKVKLGIYEYVDYSSSWAGNFLGGTVEHTTTGAESAHWKTLAMDDTVEVVEGTKYYLTFYFDSSDNYCRLYHANDAPSANSIYEEHAYGSWENPWSGDVGFGTSKTFAIYASYTEDLGDPIDIEISPLKWEGGTVNTNTNIQNNFTFWQNGTSNIDITIGINDTNFTFVTYSDWVSLGHDRFCANFTDDSWSTETNIATGYPPSTVVKSNYAPGNFNLGIRIWIPRTVTYTNKREDFEIVITVSEST